MGVVCLVNYPLPDGKSGQQTVDLLQKRVEQLGGTKVSNFSVDCETFQSQQPGTQRLVHVLHNTEQPTSCFAVLDTGTCLVADYMFDLLMIKIKSYYAPRKNAKLESKGQRYEVGDFIVKIGSVVLGQNSSFKGVLVEVEYCPCMVASDCWNMVKEFMQGFLGNAVNDPSSHHFKSKLDQMWTPTDTIMLYLEQFNALRRAAQAAGQPPQR